MTKRHHQPDGRSTIYKGADGLWHGRVSMGLTDQGRKDRRHVSSKSKTVVTEKVAEWERARDDGLAQEIQENWTVEAWLTHWLEHLSRPFVKQSTYEGYRAAVNVHLIPGIGRHRLHTLRPEHLERLYQPKQRKRRSKYTQMRPKMRPRPRTPAPPCGGTSVSPCQLAVAAGFEPAEGCPSRAFEARSLGRSDTPPRERLPKGGGWGESLTRISAQRHT